MAKFQIVIPWGKGSFSYEYFDADKDHEQAAAAKANEWLENEKTKKDTGSFGVLMGITVFKAPGTLKVIEYDTAMRRAVKRGIKFKLRLGYVKVKSGDGSTTKNEWYEAIEN